MKIRTVINNIMPNSITWLFVLLTICIICLFLFPESRFVTTISDKSTPLLALLTAAYVILTYHLLQSTKTAIQEEHRPYIVASLPVNNFSIYLSIENFGDRPAYSVDITFDPSLRMLTGDNSFEGMAEPMMVQSFMPPRFKIQNPVSSTVHTLMVPPENRRFAVTITYLNAEGRKYRENYTIDLNSYVYDKKIVDENTEGYIREIAKQMTEISMMIKKYIGLKSEH